MALRLNLTGNGTFAAPTGPTFRLWKGGEYLAEGVVPKGYSTVQAVVAAEYLTDCHLALYTMPATSGAQDQGQVAIADVFGLQATAQTVAVTIPTTSQPQPYVVRLWISGPNVAAVDTKIRTGSSYTNNPPMPTGMTVTAVTAS